MTTAAARSMDERSLVLVRHGRTRANAGGLLLGRGDPPLDEVGVAQAEALGRLIASGAFGRVNAIVSSPLLRTRQTAAAIGSVVSIDDRLVELDYGDLEGTAVADVPVATWQRWQSDVTFAPPGGESIAALGARVRDVCAEWVAAMDEPGAVILVSHVSPIKAAVAWALGVDDEVCWRTHLDTASVSRVLIRGARPVLDLFNQTTHLE